MKILSEIEQYLEIIRNVKNRLNNQEQIHENVLNYNFPIAKDEETGMITHEFGIFENVLSLANTPIYIKFCSCTYFRDILRHFGDNIVKIEWLDKEKYKQREYYLPIDKQDIENKNIDAIIDTIQLVNKCVSSQWVDTTHYENFELELEFEQIWEKIRYKKIDELYLVTEKIINIVERHFDDKFIFTSDYTTIQDLFTSLKRKNYFYQHASYRELMVSANPKFENLYKRRPCVRNLKYIGTNKDSSLLKDEIYTSTHSNGATYTIVVDGEEKCLSFNNFRRMD